MQAIHPVNPTLHDIRSFLVAHDHAVPPWSPTHTPLEMLYGLLRQRSGDDTFWRDLCVLVRSVDANRTRPAGALSDLDVDGLLDELRTAMGDDHGSPPPSMRRWAATSPIAALSGFLLLGAAMGCSGTTEDDDDDSASQQALCQEAEDHEIPQVEQDVYCQLVDIIEASSPSNDVRDELMECLPEISAEQREALLDAFLAATDEELAELLEDTAFSELCGYPTDDDDSDDH